MRVYLTTNSPGEVATWVRPILTELDRVARSEGKKVDVYVFVTPCRYASGQESDVLERLPNVKRVFTTAETARYAVLGVKPKGFRPDGTGVLLFLGGEMKLAAWLGKRLRVPTTVYTEGFVNTAKAFSRIYVPYESAKERAIRRGAPAERVVVSGNLMIDSVQPHITTRSAARERLELAQEHPVVAIFPGSRTFEWKVLVPFFTQVLAELRVEHEKVQGIMAISPFATDLQDRYGFALDPGQPQTITLHGQSVVAVSHVSEVVIQAADLVLTLPGSNTMEIAALSRPMVLALPLYHPEDIPLDGVAGMIGRIPFVGKRLKRYAVLKYSERMPFTALPNRLAQKEIAPELRGEKLQSWEVTTVASELLMHDDIRERMVKDLHRVIGGPGAARHIVSDILSLAIHPSSN